MRDVAADLVDVVVVLGLLVVEAEGAGRAHVLLADDACAADNKINFLMSNTAWRQRAQSRRLDY